MPITHGLDPNFLSEAAAARYEAELFLEATPDYYVCPENSAAFVEYMTSHDMCWTVRNLQKAYGDLKATGRIREAPEREAANNTAKSAQDKAVKFAAETRTMYEEHGIPHYGRHGTIIGGGLEDFREKIRRREYGNDAGNVSQVSPLINPHPEDLERDPSKREFACWGPDRQRRWMEEAGYWGKDLPEFLR